MKWSSSSNSSISSSGGIDMLNGIRNSCGASSSQNGVLGSNDRRSVFYTDHDIDILKTTNDKVRKFYFFFVYFILSTLFLKVLFVERTVRFPLYVLFLDMISK